MYENGWGSGVLGASEFSGNSGTRRIGGAELTTPYPFVLPALTINNLQHAHTLSDSRVAPALKLTYGWTSKAYPFGQISPELPSRAFFDAEVGLGAGERLTIRATFGKQSGGSYVYKDFLDLEKDDQGNLTIHTDLRNQKVDISGDVPGALVDWTTIVKVELYVSQYTPDLYTASETARIWLVRDLETGESKTIVQQDPPQGLKNTRPSYTQGSRHSRSQEDKSRQRASQSGAKSNQPGSQILKPMSNIQTQFKFAGTDLIFDTVHSDERGLVEIDLPPGKYEVRPYGAGFDEDNYLVGSRALIIGEPDQIGKFGKLRGDAVNRSEFNRMKENLDGIQWDRYHVIEDFLEVREIFRDEQADPNDTFDKLAFQEFGRLFKGNAYVEYFGLSTDPHPFITGGTSPF